ncbi:MAG: FmdB family transcriptional regulator [Gallionellales bacterium RIFCSPHIGHO2_02_FULL_57_16]|nr:MAG: FmdB family transcriptional regulator [Gallionellales bacterium RIFCSPHIGHO2_02_FULL_57_16]
MPIYAYACSTCGLQQDVMQKMSDAPLATCPECGKETFAKQLTAAGFQLKGSGYYVTDFKNGPKKPDTGKPEAKPDAVPVPASAASPASSGCPAKSFSAPVTSVTA